MKQNIFEFLGLPKTHRKGARVTQHVKNFSEVPDSRKFWPMYGQIKKDGVYALVVKLLNGDVNIFSRTGKAYKNIEKLVENISKYSDSQVAPAVYIAELCNDECSLETLSGIVNPNRVKALSEDQEALLSTCYLSFHDAITLSAFKRGAYKKPYYKRYEWLAKNLPGEFDLLELTIVEDAKAAKDLANAYINLGEEGIVLKTAVEKYSDWVAGHKGFRMIKIVRGVDYDLLCIGAEEGTGKYTGKISNLIFQWKDGKTVKAMLGKGWTHEDAEQMYHDFMHSTVSSPVGKIFQVYALQESSKGKLRLPKVGELRNDKFKPDV